MEFGEKVYRFDDKREFPFVSVDDNFCHMLGFGRAELFIHCRNKTKELIYQPDLQGIEEEVIHKLETEGEYTYLYRMRRKNGELLWCWESGVLEEDGSGNRVVRALVINISNEVSIRKERDTTYDNIPGGVMRLLITQSNFYIVEANKQYFEMLGTSDDEYLGSSGMYTFSEDLPSLRRYIIRKAAKREPIDYEFRSRYASEQGIRWFRLLGRYYDEVEDGCEYLCILLDVSDKRKSLFQLERERERYHVAMGTMASFLFEYDMKAKKLHVYGESGNCEYIPCIRDGARGSVGQLLKDNKLLYPDDYNVMQSLFEPESSGTGEIRLLAKNRKSGETSYQWFELSINKAWKQGQIQRIIGSVKHIEETKREEYKQQELRNIFAIQSTRMYELILCVDTNTGEMSGFFMGGPSFEEIYPNAAFDEYLEITAENYVHPEDCDRFLHSLQLSHMMDILKFSDTEEVLFFRLRKGEGEYRYKSIRYSYLGNDVNTIVISAQDVHQVREDQIKVEDANRKILASALQEERTAMEMRRNFSAMLSREIQAPLRLIDKGLRRQGKEIENIGEMRRAAAYMMRVLDNISEYERLEQGCVRFENRQFVLDEVLGEVFRGWKSRVKNKMCEISYNLNFKCRHYYGDVGRITQIINNLMGNCILASGGEGKINVWGNDEDQGDGVSRLLVTMEDWGIPVGESFFGRIYPMDSDSIRSVWDMGEECMGTSYSLILARKIAEQMGGSIRLSRKREKTNVIELDIPLLRSQDMPEKIFMEPAEKETVVEADLSGYSLLLVEEKEMKEQLTGPLLRLNGALVDIAYSGKEAVELWASYPEGAFHAILVEGNLADMDYLEFAEMFRSQRRARAQQIPILVLMNGARQDTIQESMKVGINAILNSPLELKRLKSILDVLSYGRMEL